LRVALKVANERSNSAIRAQSHNRVIKLREPRSKSQSSDQTPRTALKLTNEKRFETLGNEERPIRKGGNIMMLKFSCLVIIILSLFFIVGCLSNQGIEEITGQDHYENARKIAWEFLAEKKWNARAKDNWQTAKVEKTIANNQYDLMDKTYEGREVLVVTFEDEENVVVGTPLILLDSDTNHVVGYMLSE
jgi:outer membrane murein-binding lipoprotein Lpp